MFLITYFQNSLKKTKKQKKHIFKTKKTQLCVWYEFFFF